MRAVPMAMKAGGTLWSTRAAPTRRSFFVDYEIQGGPEGLFRGLPEPRRLAQQVQAALALLRVPQGVAISIRAPRASGRIVAGPQPVLFPRLWLSSASRRASRPCTGCTCRVLGQTRRPRPRGGPFWRGPSRSLQREALAAMSAASLQRPPIDRAGHTTDPSGSFGSSSGWRR